MKTNLKIDWATHESAKYACENWHYSKCIPKNKLVKIGVWENDIFIGVVIFGYGATPQLGKPYGLQITECCELVRIALRQHATPVSRILSLAVKFLKKSNSGIKLVVSFADKTQGHHGGIYQACNWVYSGQTAPCVFFRDPLGKLWHPRRASRVPNPEKKLVTNDWKEELQQGKHRYLLALDEKTKQLIKPLKKPYPKRVASIDNDALSDQEREGGVNPTATLQKK